MAQFGFTHTIVNENLPFPIVHYPGMYGAFFAFQHDEKSPLVLCECNKKSIRNYVKHRLKFRDNNNSDPMRNFVLDVFYFPYELVAYLMKRKCPNNGKILKYLKFSPRLCHQCNGATPSRTYCHPMYGGVFKQRYGWYVNVQFWEAGIDPIDLTFIESLAPRRLLTLLRKHVSREPLQDESDEEYDRRIQSGPSESENEKIARKITNYFENKARLKFGHTRIGESWVSETMLYHIVKKLYPKMKVIQHYHPDFLNGRELDVFVKKLNLGIEYQGIQHFEPVQQWGGMTALKKTKSVDKWKQKMCKKNGVVLVHFYYTQNLTENLVKRTINRAINQKQNSE